MCGICDIQNKEEPLNLLTEEEEDHYLLAVFFGYYTPHILPVDLYNKTAEALTKGVYKGYGKQLNSARLIETDRAMLKDLRTNVYFFAGAKTYQQIKSLNDALFEDNKRILYSEYKKKGKEILKTFNEDYLQTEYQDAVAQSRMAAKWQDIQSTKDDLPYLKYVTAHDQRVRPTHAEMEGIVRRIDDKFWDNYYPPNGWRCRCTVIQLEEGTETDLSGFKQPADVPNDFMMNSGKDKIIFPKDHPYYQVTKDDRPFARRNFDLPVPA